METPFLRQFVGDREHAERWAARRNKRYADRHPLFAEAGILDEIIEPETADRLLDRERKAVDFHNAIELRWVERAAMLRSTVAGIVSAAELASLDEKRKIYPPSVAYGCDFWWQQIKQRDPDLANGLRIRQERET